MKDTIPMFEGIESSVSKQSALAKRGFKSSQLKAISWYAKEHGLKPSLSNPPTQMHFVSTITGEEHTEHLDTILNEYKAWNKADIKSRAAERKRLAIGLTRLVHTDTSYYD